MQFAKEGEEIAGNLVESDRINASYDAVWDAMMDGVYHPEKYLPFMQMVSIADKGDHLVRETWQGDPEPTTEEIYCNKEKGEIRFESFITKIHINKYNRDEQVLEYYTEDSDGRRIIWLGSKATVLEAIEKTKKLAEANSKSFAS